MPKINGNEIRPGYILEHEGGLWIAVKTQHVKPGKGGAFAQVEMKNIRTGSKLNERFRSADKVEQVRLEQKDQQFPQKVTCTITETEPVVKGQTAANSFKPAVLDNGVRVMVPPFVGEGEAIIVNTELFEYVERA